jgi:hypothetical protein
LDISFLDSDAFLIGYYVLTVGASLLLIKDTKKRVLDLKVGISSIKYAPIPFGILSVYVLFAFDYVDQIPILNWSWLGYNIAFGPFADQGILGIIPFVPLLIYMFLHINYFALVLIPIGFVFKYIYDKKGIKHSYAMHFATNILVVGILFLSFIL